MPKIVKMTVRPEQTDGLVSDLSREDGVLSLELFRGADAREHWDVLSLVSVTKRMPRVMRIIGRHTQDHPESFSIVDADAYYSHPQQSKVRADKVESTWEETQALLQRTSSIDANFILLSMFSGVLAAIGLAMDNAFSVIASMLLLPGFQPIANIPFGIVMRRRSLVWFGWKSTLAGYGVFGLGAIATFYILMAAGNTGIKAFTGTHMVNFWSSFNISVIVGALIASAAGITILATHEPELSAGAMVALGLAPAWAIFAICLSTGHWDYMWRGLVGWLLDVGAIIATGALIFGLKQVFQHKRRMWY